MKLNISDWLSETTEGWNTPKYSLNRWLSLKVHYWATINSYQLFDFCSDWLSEFLTLTTVMISEHWLQIPRICLRETSEKRLFPFFQLWTMARAAAEVKQVPLLGGWGSTWVHVSPPHCGNTFLKWTIPHTHTPSSFSNTIKIVMHPKKLKLVTFLKLNSIVRTMILSLISNTPFLPLSRGLFTSSSLTEVRHFQRRFPEPSI